MDETWILVSLHICISLITCVAPQHANANENALNCQGNKCVAATLETGFSGIIRKTAANLNDKDLPIVPFKTDVRGDGYKTYMEWSSSSAVEQFFISKNKNSGIAVVSAGTGSIGLWEYKTGDTWQTLDFDLFGALPLELDEIKLHRQRQIYTLDWTQQAFHALQRKVLLVPAATNLRFKPTKNMIDQVWRPSEAKEEACLGFALWGNAEDNPLILTPDTRTQLTVDTNPENCESCKSLGISPDMVLLCPERMDCSGVISGTNVINICGRCRKATDPEPARCNGDEVEEAETTDAPNKTPPRSCTGLECSVLLYRIFPKVVDTNNEQTTLGWNIQAAKPVIDSVKGVQCELNSAISEPVLMKTEWKAMLFGRLEVTGMLIVSGTPAGQEDEYTIICRIEIGGGKIHVQSKESVKFIDFSRYSLDSVNPNPVPQTKSTVTVRVKPSIRSGDADTKPICILGDAINDANYCEVNGYLKKPNQIICDIKKVELSGKINLRVSLRSEMKPETLLAYQKPITLILNERPASITKVELSESLDALQVHFDRVVDGPSNCSQLFPVQIIEKLGDNAQCKFIGTVLIIELGYKPTVTQGTVMKLFAGSKSSILSMDQASKPNDGSLMQEIVVAVMNPAKKITPVFDLIGPSRVKKCEKITSMKYNIDIKSLRGTGNLPFTVVWDIYDPSQRQAMQVHLKSAEDKLTLKLPANKLARGKTYVVTSKVCNALNECSTQNHNMKTSILKDSKSPMFSVTLLGDTENAFYQEKLKFMANGIIITCDETIYHPVLKYSWEVNNEWHSNDTICEIPAYTFKENEAVTIKLKGVIFIPEINFQGENVITKSLNIKSKQLDIVTNGQSIKTGVNNELMLSVARSSPLVDQMEIAWSCSKLETDEDLTSINKTCVFDNDFMNNMENSAKLMIPAGELSPDSRYFFTASIIDGSNTMKTTMSTEVTSLVAPNVQVDPLQRANPDPYTPLDLKATVFANEDVESKIMIPSVKLPSSLMAMTKWNISYDMIKNKGLYISFTIPPANSKKFPDWVGLASNIDYSILYKASSKSSKAETIQTFKTNGPPSVGIIRIDPAVNIMSLSTNVLVAIEEVQDLPQDYPLIYKFGLIVRQKSYGKEQTIWLPPMASVTQYKFYLPTADDTSGESCKIREFQFVVQTCDQHAACSNTYSKVITKVNEATDLENDIVIVPQTITKYLDTGDYLSAFLLLEALKLEKCSSTKEEFNAAKWNDPLLNKFIKQIMNDLEKDTSELDYGKLGLINQLALYGSVSLDNAIAMGDMVSKIGTKIGRSYRTKRSTDQQGSSSAIIPHEELAILLQAYEILYDKGTKEDLDFLDDISFLKSHLCRQAKAGLDAFILAGKYVTVTAETVDANVALEYEIMQKFSMSPSLSEIYKQWSCSHNQKICSSICVSSVIIWNNEEENHLIQYFHSYANANGVRPTVTPALDWLDFVDPITGESNGAYGKTFNLDLLLNQSEILMNPKCVLVDVANHVYNTGACTTTNINRKSGIPVSITCSCNAVGVIGSVKLEKSRFINPTFVNSSNAVSFTLRPLPTYKDYIGPVGKRNEISITVSNINDTVLRFPMHVNHTDVIQFRAVSLLREYKDIDQNKAQKVQFMAENADFDVLIGDNVKNLQDKWTEDIAQSIFVQSFRIKNLVLSKGSVKVALTIEPPGADAEALDPSAGEAAMFLKERLEYKELILNNTNGKPILFDADTFTTENYDPNAAAEPAAYTTVLIVVVAGGILIAALFIVYYFVVVQKDHGHTGSGHHAANSIVAAAHKRMNKLNDIKMNDTNPSAYSTPVNSAPSIKSHSTRGTVSGLDANHVTVSTLGGSK